MKGNVLDVMDEEGDVVFSVLPNLTTKFTDKYSRNRVVEIVHQRVDDYTAACALIGVVPKDTEEDEV